MPENCPAYFPAAIADAPLGIPSPGERMDSKQRRRAEITFSVGQAQEGEGGDIRFAGVAYSGLAIEQWGRRFAVDLSAVPDGDGVELPILVDHENSIDAIAGKGRVFRAEAGDGGAELRVEGQVTRATEAGGRIAALLGAGFPLRMSIGFRARFRDAEEEILVNGRRMALDGVFEAPQIHEVSFVAVPADPAAGVREVLMCADLDGGEADPVSDTRVAQLEAELASARERAQAAEAALAELRRQFREKELSAVTAALGRDMPEDLGPWLAMPDEAFAAAITFLRDAADNPGRIDERLFAATSLDKAGDGDGWTPAERLMAAVDKLIGN